MLVMMTLAPVAARPPIQPVNLVMTLPVIEVLDPSGAITNVEVTAGLAKVQPELLSCAQTARFSGDALAWIVTDWRGKLSKLELAVQSAALEKCLAKALKKLVVTKAQARATTMVRLHWEPTKPPVRDTEF